MRAARTDNNHQDIVQELRALGFTVQSLAKVGDGCPDIAVGMLCIRRGLLNYLFEIKRADGPPSKRRLTIPEKLWHQNWRGQVDVIRSTDDALSIMKGS